MKNLLAIPVLLAIVLSSCVKENAPNIQLNDNVDTTAAMSYNNGSFINGPYGSTTGMATVYKQGDGSWVLALNDMMISNGPALHVYISKEVQPQNFIDLGALQSTLGNQLYPIPGNPDFAEYKYALIHCKQYNHLFGSAELR